MDDDVSLMKLILHVGHVLYENELFESRHILMNNPLSIFSYMQQNDMRSIKLTTTNGNEYYVNKKFTENKLPFDMCCLSHLFIFLPENTILFSMDKQCHLTTLTPFFLKTTLPFSATLVLGSIVYLANGTMVEIKSDVEVFVEYV